MITGTAVNKNGARGSFSFSSWKILKKMGMEEKDLKEIILFKDIKDFDCQIRTIETPTKDYNRFIVQVGFFESLGEIGGDIITFTYEKFPTLKEIKEDIEEQIKEYYRDLEYEDYKNSFLSNREEKQLNILRRILK